MNPSEVPPESTTQQQLPPSDGLYYTVDNDPNHWASTLKCSVCFDYFSEPRCLPCGHSFCKKCVEEIIDHTKDWKFKRKVVTFPCPHCRHQIYERQFQRFSPRNVVVESILEGWLQSKGRQKAKVTMTSQSSQTGHSMTVERWSQTRPDDQRTDQSQACQTTLVDNDCKKCPRCKFNLDTSENPYPHKVSQNDYSDCHLGAKCQDMSTTEIIGDATEGKATLGRLVGCTDNFNKKLEVKQVADVAVSHKPRVNNNWPPEIFNRAEKGASLDGLNKRFDIFSLQDCIVSSKSKIDSKDQNEGDGHRLPRNNRVVSTLLGLNPFFTSRFKVSAKTPQVPKDDPVVSSGESLEDLLYSLNDHLLPGERIQMGQFELLGLPDKSPMEGDLSKIINELFH